ncbi:HTH domain-containing protein [Brevibacillus laterosporus]|uniref:HTH domain-containing protein n=1 Tax=Brevibacillus laterosporus TaxID=1465 RepID=UPI001F21B864|nr:HTH domain-containing protein [Brevibacillus laterosporus]
MGKTRANSKVFTEQEMKHLEANPYVQHVTYKSITYAPAFKVAAVKAYQEGQTPMEIFCGAGFDIDVIGHNKPKTCLKRWRNVYQIHGEIGLLEEQRGKKSTGRPSTTELSVEEKLKRAEARIKFLEAENDFLKKLDALEKQKLQR